MRAISLLRKQDIFRVSMIAKKLEKIDCPFVSPNWHLLVNGSAFGEHTNSRCNKVWLDYL